LATTLVADPIHRAVHLDPDEWKAVATPWFQRLRRIKQLALVSLVYPGATHTRFEHSIGVRAVAAQLCDHLGIDGQPRRNILTAALLHDLGHGPFSHSSEQVVDELSDTHGIHEAISTHLIRHDPQLREILDEETREGAAALLEARARSVARDIVSGPTDADKLDYLLRDAQFCGVSYGHYDLHRIIDSAVRIEDNGRTFLGFNEDGIWAVEALLLARHHMHRAVYGHKTAIAGEIMLTRALFAGVEEGVLDRGAYRAPKSSEGNLALTDEFMSLYEQQTDDNVLGTLASGRGPVSSKLAIRLIERKLLKQSVRIPVEEQVTRLSGPQIERIEQRTRAEWGAGEDRIASAMELDPDLVAVHVASLKNTTYRLPGADIRPKDIFIRRKSGPDVELHTISEIFRDTIGPNQRFISLYTPQLKKADRQRAKEHLWDVLTEV
jgi:uncharacterized protein